MEAASSVWIRDPEARRGQWRSLLPEAEALHLEIGCGKGKFTVEMAELHPEILFIAVERVKEALVLAMEKAVALGLRNVYFVSVDAAELEQLFAPGEDGELGTGDDLANFTGGMTVDEFQAEDE